MASSSPPFASSRAATGGSASIPSRMPVARARSPPLSKSGIASMTGGPSGQAAAASSYTAAMSAADRVKLTT